MPLRAAFVSLADCALSHQSSSITHPGSRATMEMKIYGTPSGIRLQAL